ncbi:MAG: hypothetical protein NZZ41_05770 [Candidatus Dojkabacteria bacterium]|nr:hypothetical protein [Candidatus Dojkabacteria bacterium]
MAISYFDTKYFNLLNTQNIQHNPVDALLNWTMIQIRLVLLLIEIITVILLGIKIVVDTQTKNLNTRIVDNDLKLSYYAKEYEPKLIKIQEKSNNYGIILDHTYDVALVVNEIYNLIDQSIAENIVVQVNTPNILISGYDDIKKLRDIEIILKSKANYIDKKTIRVQEFVSETDQIYQVDEKGKLLITGLINSNAKKINLSSLSNI